MRDSRISYPQENCILHSLRNSLDQLQRVVATCFFHFQLCIVSIDERLCCIGTLLVNDCLTCANCGPCCYCGHNYLHGSWLIENTPPMLHS